MFKNINIKGNEIYPIGIGTWGLGGFAEINPDNDDEKQINAIVHMLQNGMNFVEIDMWRGGGRSIEIFARAFQKSGIKRDSIFITQMFQTVTCPSLVEVQKEFVQLRNILNTDYIDSIQFSLSGFELYGKEEVYNFLEKQFESNSAKFVSITNSNLEGLVSLNEALKDRVFAHEISLSFEVRENIENKVVEYAKQHDILNVVTQPLRRNRTALRNWPLLLELSEKYNKTQNQIILNWVCSLGLLPIPKSDSIEHINENLEALNFEMSDEDLKSMNDFRVPDFVFPQVAYGKDGIGVKVDQLPNVFDKLYDNKDN